MDAQEHFYSDDPKTGHPDVRTTLKDVNYYFLGNGHITAVVQICRSGEGTPVGLLIMNPEKFGHKRNCLTMAAENGLTDTMLKLSGERIELTPQPENVTASRHEFQSVPQVIIKWGNRQIEITEKLYCPDRKQGRLLREIELRNKGQENLSFRIETGAGSQTIAEMIHLNCGQKKSLLIEYILTGKNGIDSVRLNRCSQNEIEQDTLLYWQKTAACRFDSSLLNHLFNSAKYQLQANISYQGRQDASIWQYNLEWVRDQSMVVIGLTLSGQFELAGTMLDRLFTKFVTDNGDTVDSSRARPYTEVELDQNGELLLALKFYVDWSGDLTLLQKHRQKIKATAEFPLKDVFRHPEVSLMHNKREFWERHALHGIRDGMELMYQFYVCLGLESAASLAELVHHYEEATAWRKAAAEIRKDMLYHPQYALIEDNHFIKRRNVDGSPAIEAILATEEGLPANIPLLEPGKHYLDPDSSSVLPIVWEFIDAKSGLARQTLAGIEPLWNQRWTGGGYGRYHVASEPDSPGPWPFASLFIARAYFENGDDEKVWRVLRWLKQVPGAKSGATFEFYGPRQVPPYPQIGIVPWTWAEIIMLSVHHILGVRPEGNKLRLRPRLLSGLPGAKAELRVRNCRIKLEISRSKEKCGFYIDGEQISDATDEIVLDMPERDLTVELFVKE